MKTVFKTDTIGSLTKTKFPLSRNGSDYLQFQASPERFVVNKMLQPKNNRGESRFFEGVEGALNVLRIRNKSGHIHIPRTVYFTRGHGTSRIYEGIENTSTVLRTWHDATVNSPLTILGAGADANVLLVYPTLVEVRQPIRCNT